MTEHLCPFCGLVVQDDTLILYEVIGWERRRKQGGTNAIHLRQRTGKLAHQHCVDKAARGHHGQDSLWSE